jgi:hypothetical protein
MTDITKCNGTNCPIADKCHRHTSTEGEMQSWFVYTPFKIEDGVFTCDMFWGDAQDYILSQLNQIVSGDGI